MTAAARPAARLSSAVLSLALVGAAAVTLDARPCAAQASASAGNVTLKATFPDGANKVNGVLAFTVRGIASGWATGAAFQGLAKRLNLAIVMVSGGDDLNDNSYPNRCASGEFNGIGDALTKLGAASNHPELTNAPMVGIGHSHGGDYWNWYNACHPERMAAVFVHASGGVNYSAASLKVPVIYELGTGDLIENGSKKTRAGMFVNRNKGAVMSLVIGQGEGHNNVTAASLDMIVTILEATWKLRVPADADPAKGPVVLNEINEAEGGFWLGNLYTKEIAPWGSYMGNKALTAFLPSEEIARKWKETGPGLPMSITLPTDTCSWCGNPKDEPKAGPPGPTAKPPISGAAPDAGAAPPVMTPPQPPPAVTPPASPGASPPPMTSMPPSARPDPTSPPSAPMAGGDKNAPVAGGCSMAAGASAAPGAAALALLLAVALATGAFRGHRRRGR